MSYQFKRYQKGRTVGTGNYVFRHYGHGLPSEYTELEYIQSTGTQYITTNVEVLENDDYKYDIDIMWNSADARQLMGVSDNARDYFGCKGTGYYECGTAQSTRLCSTTTWDNVTFEKVVVSGYGHHTLSCDGEILIDRTDSPLYGGQLSIFNVYGIGTYLSMKAKVRKAKLFKNGALVRDLVPALRNQDNVAGMYDLVNGVFYTNAGSGTFLHN